MSSRYLLIDEYPLFILPSLAEEVGINQAIIVQQLHYWLSKSSHQRDGKTWVYNTYSDWQKQFPFWSISTIRRAIADLEEKGIIISANFNRRRIDNTKWYSLNYEALSPNENHESARPKLFLAERPLIVLPSLAILTGLTEALLLQEIYYLTIEPGTNKTKNIDNGTWVKLSNDQLCAMLHHIISSRQMWRIITMLRNKGFLRVEQFDNPAKRDNTNYYSINHEALLDALEKQQEQKNQEADNTSF